MIRFDICEKVARRLMIVCDDIDTMQKEALRMWRDDKSLSRKECGHVQHLVGSQLFH